MTRGLQKLQAQQKGQDKNQGKKGSQLDSQKAALKEICPVCKTSCTDYPTLKTHFEAKHPGKALPPPTQSK